MSIRIKLMLVSLLFMAIPLMGYEFISDMKQLVQRGQEQALMLEAKAVASVLHERQELFARDTGILLNTAESPNLYAQPVAKPIQINGNTDDWLDILQNARFYHANNLFSGPPPNSNQDISFWHLLSYDESYLYALFQVSDDQLNFRNNKNLRLDFADHLRIYIPDGAQTLNYLLTAERPGPMSSYQLKDDWRTPVSGAHETAFLAAISPNDSGYTIELRIPINRVLSAGYIAFSIVDFDTEKDENTIISTLPAEKDIKLNRVLLRSPQIEKILTSLDKPNGRIWVVDQYQRVRAVVGSLQTDAYAVKDRWYNHLFSFLLSEPPQTFSDHPKDADILTNEAIVNALKNKPNSFIRKSVDKKATILSAAVPIETDGLITGAVIVEQTNNQLLALENEALLSVVKRTFVVFLLATVTMVWFATRLTYRINRLHRETSQSIDESGGLKSTVKITIHAKDELGKLAASISQMLNSLSQHTRYLERMPRTLRHEILNPLNVINTSLENLNGTLEHSEHTQKYMTSAQNGIRRLGSILHSLTEASTLEEALTSEEKETFDMVELVQEYMEHYQSVHPNYQFVVDLPTLPVPIVGWPESIAQMLDKILDNAVDFSDKNGLITIMLKQTPAQKLCIYISNQGKNIPAEIRQNLFESMVSKRSDSHNHKPHLGLGLYVARVICEAHHGSITVRNTRKPQGVEFAICLPRV